MPPPGDKPRILFVTPAMPETTGMGVNMRAGIHVEALSQWARVTLALALPGHKGDPRAALTTEVAKRCDEILSSTTEAPIDGWLRRFHSRAGQQVAKALYPAPFMPARFAASCAALATQLTGRHFDTVVCFRLHAASFVQAMRRCGITAGRLILDLDDYESKTQFRQAWLLRASLGKQVMLTGMLEALKLRACEQRTVPRFDTVLTCSELDRIELARRFDGTRFAVMPNVVRPPREVARVPREAFTFLFLGAMGYHPNFEAAEYFCREVLPLLRASMPGRFRIVIAGRDSLPTLAHLQAPPEVEVIGEVAEVADCYARSDAVIVPLRSGGGTRIKIIEALAYGLPVVSTRIGAEGLDVRHELHVLLADEAPAFAAACRAVAEDAALRRQLVDNGRQLWTRQYTLEAATRRWQEILGA